MLPNRWGRNLIKVKLKNSSNNAIYINNEPSIYDYLINTSDYLRTGFLIVLDKNSYEFLSKEKDIPILMDVSNFEKEAIRFSKTKSYDKNIEILINLGSSLGGARPKANVKDEFTNLWIAKVPSHNDDYDVEKFECLLLELARSVNLTVPSFKLTKYSKYGSTLFSKRFDRNKEKRIHYISSLTLLNAQDGESSNYSYLDLVILIKEYSSDPNLDLLELYKRMIFNIITSNTDDHLRNHGFIISEDFKIRLSPLFDLNPVKNSYTHALNIFNDMKEINLDNLINYSKYFNLSKDEGKKIIEEINMTIKDSLNTLFKIYSFNRFEKEYIHSSLKYIEN